MFLLVIVVIFAVCVATTLWWYYEYYRFHRYLKRFPGPKPLPLVGNALDFRKRAEIMNTLSRYQNIYGAIVRLTWGTQPFVYITDYKFANFVLSSRKLLTKLKQFDYIIPWLGNGLFVSSGDIWKSHRKILTPGFHPQMLEQFVEVFDSGSGVFVEKLRNEVGKKSVNVDEYTTLCLLDIICESLLKTSVNAQENKTSDYALAVREIFRIWIERSVSLLKWSSIGFRFSTDFQKQKKAIKILHSFSSEIVKTRKAELAKIKNDCNPIESDVQQKEKLSILDLLLRATVDGQPLSDVEIRYEVDTFLAAGFETTATAVSFILYSLAHHPVIQKKVVEEMKGIFCGDLNRPVTYKDLQGMKYLDMVVKETLRLYPISAMISRQVTEDVEYEGEIIPKGVNLIIGVLDMAWNPHEFPDPQTFDPERFNPDNIVKHNPLSYIPFGAGLRKCIGYKFAMLEMKTIVTKVLKSYELFPTNPPHKLQLALETVLKSSNGICIRIGNRKN